MLLKMKTAYEILDVEVNATKKQILTAYRKARNSAHPDKGGTVEQFLAVKEAFKKLNVRKCPLCAGKGFVVVRYGIFARKELCEKCWKLGDNQRS